MRDILSSGRQKRLCALLACALAGCQASNHATEQGVVGAGFGALTGAFIGNHVRRPGTGAAIGAAAGGAVGAAKGRSQDLREQAEDSAAAASYREAQRIALRNDDVIEMASGGLSEDVIISTVEKSLSLYDFSGEEMVRLKQAGVTDRTIVAMQNSLRVRPVPTPRSIR